MSIPFAPEPSPMYRTIFSRGTQTSRSPRMMKMGGSTRSISLKLYRVTSIIFAPRLASRSHAPSARRSAAASIHQRFSRFPTLFFCINDLLTGS